MSRKWTHSNIPATASEWFTYSAGQVDLREIADPVERQKRLIERYLCSKGLATEVQDGHQDSVDFREDI